MPDTDDVDDLLQKSLIKTHTNLSELRDQQSIRAWLIRVASNATINHYRKSERGAAVHYDDLLYGSDDDTEHSDQERCVVPIITVLSPAEAELPTAVDVNGESQKAIAARSDASYATVKSLVRKVRLDLRRLFDTCCALKLGTQGAVADYSPRSVRCGSC